MQRYPGNVFREMDEMIDRLFSDMEREFVSARTRYGYRIAIRGGEEDPQIPDTDSAIFPSCTDQEPVAEVHSTENEVRVIANLPGITEEELRLGVKDNLLVIDAGDADHHCHTTAELPPVDPASMQKTLKNGVLEVTFAALRNPEKA